MAKGILWFFGIANLIGGIVFLLIGFNSKANSDVLFGCYLGAGAFLGGALLLGFARIITLLEQIVENTASPAATRAAHDPRPGNLSLAGVDRQDTYLDRPYTVHGDGMVVSRINGSPATWRTEAEFKAWADGQKAA